MRSLLFFPGLACLATLTMAAPSPPSNAGSTLFVASYAGNITSLRLSRSPGKYELSKISDAGGCAPNPSWLTLDHKSKALYCVDEGLTVPDGSLSSFNIKDDGSLGLVEHRSTINGPVHASIFGNVKDTKTGGKKGLVLAHYVGSAVTTWELSTNSTPSFSHVADYKYTLTKPGAVPDRQDAPHEHETIQDPTGQYILVPDLGADLVRVFSHDKDLKLTALTPLSTTAGYGPRHGVFYKPAGKPGADVPTFFYVVGELSNNVTGYAVTYLPNNGGLSFKQVYESTTYGDKPVPVGNAAAEVALSPDSRFLVVSNRNNSQFELPNYDPKNSTKIKSDSLTTFAVNPNGSLDFQGAVPCGGSYPRQFSMNGAGDLVAVGLQYGNAVVVLERDVLSGKIGKTVAWAPIEGQVTCARWNEPVFDGTYSSPV